MYVKINSVQFKADVKLTTFIENRVKKLELFHDSILGADVYLRLDKNKAIDNKICEIKLHIPGHELFAKKQCNSFEEATDEAAEAMRRQIRKLKGKTSRISVA